MKLFWTLLAVALLSAPVQAQKVEKFRAAYPAIAPGSTPSWVTAETGLWRKYGFDVEPILVSGGARAVPALIGQSVQFLLGSDTGVTTAQLNGLGIVRLGVTMNNLGSSVIAQPSIQSVRDLKGKLLGISRGRDASYIRLAKLLRDHGLNPNEDVKFLSIGAGEGARLSAVKAGVVHATMLFPPFDLIARNEGLKVLEKFDVPTPGGGINVTATLLKQNRPLVLNFLKGYLEGIHYMIGHKAESEGLEAQGVERLQGHRGQPALAGDEIHDLEIVVTVGRGHLDLGQITLGPVEAGQDRHQRDRRGHRYRGPVGRRGIL